MDTVIITLLFIAAIALLICLLCRRSSLERLAALPGEFVICEERGTGVDEKRIFGDIPGVQL